MAALYATACEAIVDIWWEWAGVPVDVENCWGPELEALTEAEQNLHGLIVLVPGPLGVRT